jgi:GH25 family lysozyme M1 (1,4-beta-N-acetylmuramidase)
MTQYLDTWTRDRHAGKLSLLSKLKLHFLKQAASLIGTLDPTTLARGIDISHWQGDVDIAKHKAEGDISFVFPKASDGKQLQSGDPTYAPNYIDDWLYRNVQKCYLAKVACIPYHYVQPFFADYNVTGTIVWNMKCLHAALDPLTPKISYHAIMLDVEEITGTEPNRSDVVLGMMSEIALDPKMSQVPLIIYSSNNILNNYYPKLMNQLSYQGANKNLFLAQWVYTTVTATSWANIISSIMPTISMKVLTPGYATWKFLQWTAAFSWNSVRIDLDFYNGTKAALFSWLGFNPGTDTVAPTVPTNFTTVVTGNSVVFNWIASTDAVGVAGYKLYIDQTLKATLTATTSTISGFADGTYNAEISAIDAAGNESARASSVFTVKTIPDNTLELRVVALETSVNLLTARLSDLENKYSSHTHIVNKPS